MRDTKGNNRLKDYRVLLVLTDHNRIRYGCVNPAGELVWITEEDGVFVVRVMV